MAGMINYGVCNKKLQKPTRDLTVEEREYYKDIIILYTLLCLYKESR